MSDCFDHALDAFESGFYGDVANPGNSSGHYREPRKSTVKDRLIMETGKAMMFEYADSRNTLRYWMPKTKVNKGYNCYHMDSYIRGCNMARAYKELDK